MGFSRAPCGAEDDSEVDEPEAVEPVEIVGDGEETDGTHTATVEGEAETDVAALQARIAELEGELAECRGEDAPAEGGTQTAAVPEGVDVPAGSDADSDDDDDSDSAETASASSSRRGRRGRREPGLLGTLLGDGEEEGSGRRGRGRSGSSDTDTDDDGVVLDPSRVIFGN